MIDRAVSDRISYLVRREALCLDRRRWDEWTAMYSEDAVFWVPAWKDVDTPTEDPESEISLIYLRGRASLADRVWRLKSGMSIASETPLRTAHIVGPPVVEQDEDGAIGANCAWTCFTYDPNTHNEANNFGLYEYTFTNAGDELLISKKRVILLNERVATLLDVYCV